MEQVRAGAADCMLPRCDHETYGGLAHKGREHFARYRLSLVRSRFVERIDRNNLSLAVGLRQAEQSVGRRRTPMQDAGKLADHLPARLAMAPDNALQGIGPGYGFRWKLCKIGARRQKVRL